MASKLFCSTCKTACPNLLALMLHRSRSHKYATTNQNGHKGYWPKKGRNPWAKGIHRVALK